LIITQDTVQNTHYNLKIQLNDIAKEAEKFIMNKSSLLHFLKKTHVHTEAEWLLDILNNNDHSYVFIKDTKLKYLYANQLFLNLLGINSLNGLINKKNDTFYNDKSLIKCYRECDEYVIEEQKSLLVCEPLAPKLNRNIKKVVEGQLYPIYSDSNKVEYVLGVVSPKSKLIHLDWETIFRLSTQEINTILTKRSYVISVNSYTTTLSKMEIRTLIELFKGKNANEIAEELYIQQTTVESYLKNIRNKLGASSKSELINVLIRENVLKQIIL
jgi:DNA-binding CsgD family transcriptional regulator